MTVNTGTIRGLLVSSFAALAAARLARAELPRLHTLLPLSEENLPRARSSRGTGVKARSTLLVLVTCLIPQTAAAYIDPNLGGMLLQWVAPIFALMIAFWSRIKHSAVLVFRYLKNLIARTD